MSGLSFLIVEYGFTALEQHVPGAIEPVRFQPSLTVRL